MDEVEFRRLLDLFPVVRSRNYHPDSESRESTSRSKQDELTECQSAWSEGDKPVDYEDLFWGKLKLAAERKVGPLEAERFCKAFQTVHKHLVCKELSVDAAKSFL